MPYSAASVANAFLSHSFESQGQPITPMKMQKLAYLAHGHTLVECHEPLLDELFEAWKFGPVLPTLYHQCKRYKYGTITNYIEDYDRYTEMTTPTPAPLPDDPHVLDIIKFVWSTYGGESAMALSDWTHVKGGPWDKVTRGGENLLRNQDIPNEYIAAYFRENMYDDLFDESAKQKAAEATSA